MAKRDRLAETDVSRNTHENVRQPARVEAEANRERVAGLALEHRGAERLQPRERVVKPIEDEPLERGIAAGTLGAKDVERPVAPDHPARKQHRATGPVALLEHERLGPELARPRGRHEPGHPRPCDEH